MKSMDLFDFFVKDAEKPFSGWDFSYLTDTGRMASEPLNWNYTSKILASIRKADTLLDMGTGGGEYLSKLQPFPRHTFATEAYEPNVPIARNRLEPLGVKVIEVKDDNQLPFDNEQFDLIINKHEAYSVSELYRILKPGNHFITQQVGGKDHIDLNEALGANADNGYSHWNMKYAVDELKNAGFKISKSFEQFPYTRFYDVGAIIYYLSAIPWQIPDFSVQKYYDKLLQIHEEIQKNGYIDFKEHRFFIIAVK
ncbi:class I SAM-dependent methyltransferase [Bacillus sp. FJAT-49736]|uniref:class I SAM-dependent methyltransferase n=1 Tax=Bacillus sp. FJAT-49736 TaxID=2833582 RepID=UPI001BC9D125|nr:class I SAM-dependent methyltransferase [Bacillus sp. FJAT-49736]MBS4174648.1 class I SAM-dependent methyltransferase [Bacillus sp. FJAT-49736]